MIYSNKITNIIRLPSKEEGFSLVETLVALVIFALAILGFISMQSRGLQMNVEVDQREQASRLVNYMVEAIRTNPDARGCYITIAGEHGSEFAGTGTTGEFACNGSGTTATQKIANDDLNHWDDLLKGDNQGGALIDARGCVAQDAATGNYIISVVWQGLIDTESSDNLCANVFYPIKSRRVLSYTLAFADLGN